jgi:hypothetical protein
MKTNVTAQLYAKQWVTMRGNTRKNLQGRISAWLMFKKINIVFSTSWIE